MPDRIDSRSENGYIRFYDTSTGDTVNVLTGGPCIIQHFNGVEEMYTDTALNSSTSVIANGVCTVTTGAADDDDHDFASGLFFDPSKGLTAEAWIALGDADKTGFNFGFSDAIDEGADKIAVTYATSTLTTNCTDGAVLFSDAAATTDFVGAVAVHGTTGDGTLITASSTALVDNAYHRYKVEIDPAGNCKFYYDNVLAGTQALGVATTATLCAYFALINKGESATNTAALKYMHAWQWIA